MRSSRRAAYALLAFLFVVVAGVFALGRLPFALLPSSPSLRLHVDVQAPGLHAAAVAAEVSGPLEAALAGLGAVDSVESLSVPGAARVTLRLSRGADRQQVQHEAEERLRMAAAALPAVLNMTVSLAEEPAWPAVEYVLAVRGAPPPAFQQWVRESLVAPLEASPVLARVAVEGQTSHAIEVHVDTRRLAGLGLSLDEVIAAVRRHAAKRTWASGTTPAAAAEALAATPVTLPSGEGIALAEMAHVTVETRTETLVRDDGEPVLLLAAYPRSPSDAYRAAETVKAHIAWLQANRLIPPGVELRLFTDRAAEARRALKPVALGLLAAVSLVLLLVQVLFSTLRLTLLLAATLTGAFSLALAYMAASGLALDLLTLGALTGGCGILALPALLTRGIHAAARRRFIAIGLAPVLAVFALLWPEGEEAVLIVRGFVVPLAAAWLGATLTAVYLAPLLAPRSSVRGLAMHLEERTARWCARAARYPRATLVLIALAALAFAAATARHEFLPALDEAGVQVRFQVDEVLSLQEGEERVGQLERLIREIPGSVRTLTRVSRRDPWHAAWSGEIRAQLGAVDPRLWRRMLEERLAKTPTIAGLRIEAVIAGFPGLHAGRESGVLRLRLLAPASAQLLYATADEIARRLETVFGLRDVYHDGLVQQEQIVMGLDPERTALLGIEVSQAARALAAATTGIEVGRWSGNGGDGAIRLLLSAAARIPLLGEVRDRPVVYLHDVGEIERRVLPALIRHERTASMLEITARIAEGQDSDVLLERVRAALAQHVLPTGYALEYVNAPCLAGWGEGPARVAGVLFLVSLALWVSRVIPDQGSGSRALNWPEARRGWRSALVMSTGLGALIAVTAAVLAAAGVRFSLSVWAGMIVLAALGTAGAAIGVWLAGASGHGENVDRAMPLAWVVQLPALIGPLVLAAGGGAGAAVLRPFALTLLVGGVLMAIFSFVEQARDASPP